MTTKNNMLTDISAELEKEFGKHGTPERAKFDEEAKKPLGVDITIDSCANFEADEVNGEDE